MRISTAGKFFIFEIANQLLTHHSLLFRAINDGNMSSLFET